MKLISFFSLGCLLLPSIVHSCSNFILGNDNDKSGSYRLSGRTMDLGLGLQFGIHSYPIGQTVQSPKEGITWNRTIGFIGFTPREGPLSIEDFVPGGLNTFGLSCDQQTLITANYSSLSNLTAPHLSVNYVCHYILSTQSSLDESRKALSSIKVWAGDLDLGGFHFALRDSSGKGLVIEYVDGTGYPSIYDDDYGIMTNEPEYPFHLANLKHFIWKQSLDNHAVAIPGGWYPDDRFLRLYAIKNSFTAPKSYQHAIHQALSLISSVTVPESWVSGKDSADDQTLWAAIYDHNLNSTDGPTIYWKTEHNYLLQRIRLMDVNLGIGAPVHKIEFDEGANDLPWFNDVSQKFK